MFCGNFNNRVIASFHGMCQWKIFENWRILAGGLRPVHTSSEHGPYSRLVNTGRKRTRVHGPWSERGSCEPAFTFAPYRVSLPGIFISRIECE